MQLKILDPKQYGLPARTILEQIDEQTIAIVINRTSRIIMADGIKLLERVNKVEAITPSTTIILKTNAPVCSKTMRFLEEAGIKIDRL